MKPFISIIPPTYYPMQIWRTLVGLRDDLKNIFTKAFTDVETAITKTTPK